MNCANMATFIYLTLMIVASPSTASLKIEAASKVKVSAFFEALCPDSKRFVNDQLHPTYLHLRDIMEVDANAYGKATSEANGSGYNFKCQHGTKECHRNMLMACAKKYLQENEYLHYVHCIMEGKNGSTCAGAVGMSPDVLETCSSCEEGQHLLYQTGLRQNEVAPSLNFVPWVAVNDGNSKEKRKLARQNLKQVVCENYEGPTHPACVGINKDTDGIKSISK